MKARLTLLAVVLTCAVPVSSPAAQTTTVRDDFWVQVYAETPAGSAWVSGWIRRLRSVEPSVTPGNIFPIVIDPNNPPAAPARAFSETFEGTVNVGECASNGCSFGGVPLSEVELRSVDVPAPSNSFELSINSTLPSGDFAAVVRWERPQNSTVPLALGGAQLNPWTSGNSAHVDVALSQWLGSRYGYSALGTISSPMLGTTAVTSGYGSTDRYLQVAAEADVN